MLKWHEELCFFGKRPFAFASRLKPSRDALSVFWTFRYVSHFCTTILGQSLKVKNKKKNIIVSDCSNNWRSPQTEDFTPKNKCWISPKLESLPIPTWHAGLLSPTGPPLATGQAACLVRGNFHLPPPESRPTGPALLQWPWPRDAVWNASASRWDPNASTPILPPCANAICGTGKTTLCGTGKELIRAVPKLTHLQHKRVDSRAEALSICRSPGKREAIEIQLSRLGWWEYHSQWVWKTL